MSDSHPNTSTAIVVAGIEILQDASGRYNLNTLHHASEAAENDHKKPSEWLKRKSTKALVAELCRQSVNIPFDVVVGGNASGVYAHELLAVEYAGWISPRFRLLVNQAFIDSRKPSTLPVVKNLDRQALIHALECIDALEQRVNLLETAHLPPEGKYTTQSFVAAFNKPRMSRMRWKQFNRLCWHRESAVHFVPTGTASPLQYYSVETLEWAFQEAFLGEKNHERSHSSTPGRCARRSN